MDSALFYQVSGVGACVLKLVSVASWQKRPPLNQPAVKTQVQEFSAQLGETAYDVDVASDTKTILIGTGNDVDRVTAIAVAALKLPAGVYAFEETLSEHELLVWSLAQYRFDKYKACAASVRCLSVTQPQYDNVVPMAASIFLVRDLINTPTQDMGPADLVLQAQKLATDYHAAVTVCEGAALLNEGYPAVHAVGRAASTAPCLIDLSWGKAEHPLVVLVGKGVCFDSGGLDIKTASGMRLMKKDMGGAAQVLGLANWIMASKLPIRLNVLIPAVENAVGPESYHPGDVIRMRNGLTVEIENTDAEGRLILADSLVKACEAKPALVLDFSTLTGAARVAVGTEISAMFSNNDAVAEGLCAASQAVNDPIWRLPLFTPYEAMLESSIADLMNSSNSSYAGAITAALFLRKFVNSDTPWVHFDLMAWNLSNKPGKPEGGEAMALRAVAHYLRGRFM
ncbi:MAG: leucyl aminopeptidase family protein [Gammaproteobacteria bacterium]|nr:leucyl aminopeptidase family protein [Gammaproteobacteria bacterium]